MSQTKPTTVRFDDSEIEEIKEFGDRIGAESQTEAIQEMVHVAHRESKHPLTHRMKDQVVDWVGNLGIAAVMVFVGGATTPVLDIGDAALFSVSLVVVSVLLLAGYEAVRLVTGTNEIGERLRVVVGEAA